MQGSDEGVAKHFFLAEGQQKDIPPALGPVDTCNESGVFSTEQDISGAGYFGGSGGSSW
jgi:hypothetical protein